MVGFSVLVPVGKARFCVMFGGSSLLLGDGAEAVDLGKGIGLKGGAAAQEPVDVRLFEEVLGVLLVGRAA